eukprot:Gb_18678 [translate_table: standard]
MRVHACCLLATKSTLATQVGSTRDGRHPTEKIGRDLRDKIRKKITKWQEPPPSKQPKLLPVLDSQPKTKHRSRRLCKMKERYAITDMRKLANQMQFGIREESSLGDGLGEGYGMLGQARSKKLHVSIGKSKLATKAAKKFKEKHYGSNGSKKCPDIEVTQVHLAVETTFTVSTGKAAHEHVVEQRKEQMIRTWLKDASLPKQILRVYYLTQYLVKEIASPSFNFW